MDVDDVEPWYRLCVAYSHTPDGVRRELAKPTRSSWLRVARMPERIGNELDRERAPFRVYRFVAWGAERAAACRRYDLVKRLRRERGRWPLDGTMYAAWKQVEGSPAGGE